MRLEHEEKEEVGDDYRIFQFHKGAIRTVITFEPEYFDKVDFNSIKVRLELNSLKVCAHLCAISIP